MLPYKGGRGASSPKNPPLTATHTATVTAELDRDQEYRAWDLLVGTIFYQKLHTLLQKTLIPVVTFLAPLASNFEGLKDR